MLEMNIKGFAVSWVVYLIIFAIRELYVERRDAVSSRRYTGGPITRKKQSFGLGQALAAFSFLVILAFVGLLLAMFGIDFVVYISSLAAAILVGSFFVAWFRRLRRGKYRTTVDTPGLVCFETDFGKFQVNTAHSSFRFEGKRSGSWPLADIRHLEFEATQRWSLIADLILGWNPTDIVEDYRDRLEYYAIYIMTTDGRRQPLYIASQLRPREFLMNWYIRFQEAILERLGLFKNGYWDNPAYLLPPEADLMATTHYLEALDLQKEIVKVHTIFGGKNPHPNWLVGGVPCAINVDEVGAVGAVNMERLNLVSSIIDQTIDFIDNVYTYRNHVTVPISWRGDVGCRLDAGDGAQGCSISGTAMRSEQIGNPTYLKHISK